MGGTGHIPSVVRRGEVLLEAVPLVVGVYCGQEGTGTAAEGAAGGGEVAEEWEGGGEAVGDSGWGVTTRGVLCSQVAVAAVADVEVH